jgi:hypothetical protein
VPLPNTDKVYRDHICIYWCIGLFVLRTY